MNKKLGYYTCNGKEFESKIQAMMLSNFANKPVQWHFNDKEFGEYNWSIEPELTMDQLYDRRARELREQYDYLVLCYSGGSDSNNILESFIRQGLHIDEIVTNWTLDISKEYTVLDRTQRSAWNYNAEFELHTKQRLAYINKVSPKTKITVLDTSKGLLDSFIDANDASWVNNKKEVLNAYGTNNYNFKYFAEVRKRFDSQQSIGLIIGTDKPKLRIIDNKLYLYFMDKSVNMIQVQDHMAEYSNAHPVLFYWDPMCCDMLAKQCHVVLKFVNTYPQHRETWASTNYKVVRQVQEELLKKLVYTTWDQTWFQVIKSVEDWDSELDYWFTRGRKDTKEYQIWQEGIQHVQQRVTNFLMTNENGTIKGTVPFNSPLYYIGDLINL